MTNDDSVEHVLVVPTELFHGCGHFNGFSADVETYAPLFENAHQRFIRRSDAERDPRWKQLIPYVCIEKFGDHVFTYCRGRGQGEERLHGLRSVGFGGHINPGDDNGEPDWPVSQPAAYLDARYLAAVVRELCEELTFSGVPVLGMELPVMGLINDDTTPVGEVHLGVVHKLSLPDSAAILPNEDDIHDFKFVALDTVANSDHAEFETWSQICLKQLLSPNGASE